MMNVTPASQGVARVVKTVLKRTIYRPGSIARVLRGPLRGHRFILRETPNWASILGQWEPEAACIYQALLRPGQVVYDCGANVGMHALLFAKVVGPTGKVFAFEPLPAAARDVLVNCALNDVQNVTLVESALSDSAGWAEFVLAPYTTQGSLSGMNTGGAGQILKVRVTTMDKMVEEGTPSPDFVKMDIEGAEGAALQGFTSVSRSYPTFAIDLHTPEQDVLVGAFLARHGYRVYRVGDGKAKRRGQERLLQPILSLDRGWPEQDGVWGTIIAVHPSRALESIIESLG